MSDPFKLSTYIYLYTTAAITTCSGITALTTMHVQDLPTSYVLATSEGQVLLQICSCLGVGQIDRLSLMFILDGDEVGDVSPVVLLE